MCALLPTIKKIDQEKSEIEICEDLMAFKHNYEHVDEEFPYWSKNDLK